MLKIFILIASFIAVSCATPTRQTDALVKSHSSLPEHSKIPNFPLIIQKRNHCGPATLAMVIKFAGKEVEISQLTQQMFTEKMQGTFQSDMLSTARHQGMLTIPINDMTSLIKEVSLGHPVLVFQNLGTSWWPKWHYAVVTGHDFGGPDILLHTGKHQYDSTDMRLFERSWLLGDYWGLLVLRPDQLSHTGSEAVHVQAAAMLESLGKIEDAKLAYETILRKWPQSLGALIGLGNVNHLEKHYQVSADYLSLAVKFHPVSAIAWHNLAFAQESLKKQSLAKKSAEMALSLVDEASRNDFQKSLSQFFTPIGDKK